MNPLSRRSTRENAKVGKEPTDTTVAAKSKPESKPAIISYDYEAAISQPDISTYPEIDNNTQNSNWSDPSEKLSAPIKKRNLYARGKTSVTTKKRSIIFKPKLQTKNVTKIRQQTCDVAEIKKESVSISEIIRNTENFGQKKCDVITANREASSNLHQKNLTHSGNVQKLPEIAEDDKNSACEVVSQGIRKSYKNDNFDKIDKDAKLCISQNKASKIPRIKPNFLSLRGESYVYPSTKLSVKNKFQCSTNMKSPTVFTEERNELENNSKKESLTIDYQKKSKTENILQTVHKNSTNFWYLEKSSEMDTDEELEDLPTPTKESSIITGAGDDPRSATLLKSLTLKCDCRSCSDHKYASVHTNRHIETESWSSLEMESARKRKSIKRREFIDVSSEDLDLLSDYNTINYSNVKTNGKNNEMSNFASYITKPSLTANSARMKTYRNGFSFFNVFFDIVFWPFIFLRAKQ